jgi:hypothetical protein
LFVASAIYAYSRSPGGVAIKHWPGDAPPRWSHAGIMLSAQPADDSPALVFESVFPRARFTTYDKFIERYNRRVAIVRFEVEASPEQQRAWCEERDGQPYALWTLLGYPFGLRSSQNGADHCGELVENALRDWGCVPRWREDHHRISPNASFNNLSGVAR